MADEIRPDVFEAYMALDNEWFDLVHVQKIENERAEDLAGEMEKMWWEKMNAAEKAEVGKRGSARNKSHKEQMTGNLSNLGGLK